MLVGTAFDYLLRFEIKRRAPHAVCQRWIAELVPDMIWSKTDTGSFGLLLGEGIEPEQLAQHARKIVQDGLVALEAYTSCPAPTPVQQADLAAHAIRWAKLDSVARVRKLDPQFAEAAPEDVQDLLALLGVVPFDLLTNAHTLVLNPTFGESSSLVGGADADLITGDLLVDFKTTKQPEMSADDLDQLLGYFLFARRQRTIDRRFPPINKLGFYFSRHGHLWTAETSQWTSNPRFSEIEEWFFKRASELSRAPAGCETPPPNEPAKTGTP
jgi:hypothetical protein